MTEGNAKNSYTVWQKSVEEGVGEPSLLIEEYRGCFQISQSDGNEINRININYEMVNELCKLFKKLKEPA